MPDDNAAPAYDRGPAESITIDLPADVSRALSAWIASQPAPKPDRATAILVALRDVLVGLGHMEWSEMPEGRDALH